MTGNAVSFVAKSGTGKTTLLEKVIGSLKRRGYRVGVIKHDAHRFEIDHPGKDSYRLTAAGADDPIACLHVLPPGTNMGPGLYWSTDPGELVILPCVFERNDRVVSRGEGGAVMIRTAAFGGSGVSP